MADYIATGEAAKLLGVTPTRVIQLALEGTFTEALRIGNRRLYLRRDVERFARHRAATPPRPGSKPKALA